ncbi:MAG: PVC-type heme-binding CxxCH protein, partial [Opitutales bacterium]
MKQVIGMYSVTMRVSLFLSLSLCALFGTAWAAEVGEGKQATAPFPDFQMPKFTLPKGFIAEVVAAPPLTRHPMMAAFDDRGRLFVAESAGLNLKQLELEKRKPNFVRMLEDEDGDGVFDKATVFADRMTFPQGVLWLDGSLYVASPPGIWKLTDTDDDGKADKRRQIVTGFNYTGNAADVHGPFLHPLDGRIYWCHGRKGHEVRNRDKSLVSKGKGARIWSSRPDGSDVRVHAGGGMDNPVEIDFTPEGDIIGSVNLFHGRPRGDVLVHWLRGGRYPRRDQGAVLQEFKSTGPLLAEAHNFGHVAVSGMCIAKGALFANSEPGQLDVLTTLFNTQEVARTTLSWKGATLVSLKNDTLLKIDNPDVHLTDVLEDSDGSLLLVDTGGWFRIGCPNSVLAKPEIPGAIYRIRPVGPRNRKSAPKPDTAALPSPNRIKWERLLASENLRSRYLAAEALGRIGDARSVGPLVQTLTKDLDRTTEHAVLWSLIEIDDFKGTLAALQALPVAMVRGIRALDQMDSTALSPELVIPLLGHVEAAIEVVGNHPDWAEAIAKWCLRTEAGAKRREVIVALVPRMPEHPAMQGLVTHLLKTDANLACEALAALPARMEPPKAWVGPLRDILQGADDEGALGATLKAVQRLEIPTFRPLLQGIAENGSLPSRIRLLALRALSRKAQLSEDEFSLLLRLLGNQASPADRGEAVALLGSIRLTSAQCIRLADFLPRAGATEFPSLLQAFVRSRDERVGRALAKAVAKAPVAGSLPVTELERILNRFPPEATVAARPRMKELRQAVEGRRERLAALVSRIAAEGDAERGKAVFESGVGVCITCHRIGDKGIAVGPDLTTIGRIRQPVYLLESILFPSASIARDFEAYSLTR